MLRHLVTLLITAFAKKALAVHRPKVVAITGSVGKTGSKDAIAAVLASEYSVRKSQKSFNSEIGVPLAILGLPNAWKSPVQWMANFVRAALVTYAKEFPEWLVLEVGVDHPGDMKRTASWLSTQVVVLTRLPDVPVHVEFFKSPEDVAKEKLELLNSLTQSGVLIVNADDSKLSALIEGPGQQKITYGFREGAMVRAESSAIAYENGMASGMRLRISVHGASVPILLRGVIGDGHTYAVLAAIAVASATGVNLVDATRAIESDLPTPGRMRLIPGMHGSLIIDDSYNASPAASEVALSTLAKLSGTGKKIFVLGDMKELGKFSQEMHEMIGSKVARVYQEGKISHFMTVGELSAFAAKAAAQNGMPPSTMETFSSGEALSPHIAELLTHGDVVLIKGSQSMRLERVVEALMAKPEDARELLVRQESEWRRR